MAYILDEVTIRTNNSPEGMENTAQLWRDVTEGRLPLLFDSEHNFRPGISPVSAYSNYADEDRGDYDLSIIAVRSDFFGALEQLVAAGEYRKYEAADPAGDLVACTEAAWRQVWEAQANGELRRAFTLDYESSVPAEYTKDGRAHCYLYIAVK